MYKMSLWTMLASGVVGILSTTGLLGPTLAHWILGVIGATGVSHNVMRGIEDGLTKFRAAATANGNRKDERE